MSGPILQKPLVWLGEAIKVPPFSEKAADTAGYLLGALQRSQPVPPKRIRPMPSVAAGCLELKIRDGAAKKTWRILYRIDADAIVISAVFEKGAHKTPKRVIEAARDRLKRYDEERTHGR